MNRREFVSALGTSIMASGWTRSVLAKTGLLRGDRPGLNNPAPRYQPNWASLKQHVVPKWFEDAKLGIFIHYGLYSVPAWAPTVKLTDRGEIDWGKFAPDQRDWFVNNPYAEWYMNSWRIKGSPTWEHHVKTYGANFDYLDFIPMFDEQVRKWDPDEWAELFKQIGAGYIVPTTRHHDGFKLWPSKVPNPHRKPNQQSTKRDVIGELAKAVRKQNIHMGIYFSGGLDWSFTPNPIRTKHGVEEDCPQTEEYGRYADAILEELIRLYEPDDIWDDIAYPRTGNLTKILADYFNLVPEGTIDDRFHEIHKPPEHADYTSPEGVWPTKIVEKKWESCHALGTSFGYNQNEGPGDMLSPGKLINMFVDVVSKNGNLLLDIGPKADGSIPELQLTRLREFGKWMHTNGEAIYETRPWVKSDGQTTDGLPVRFTRKGDAVYAILTEKPGSREVIIESLQLEESSQVQMLGVPKPLSWTAREGNVHITLPNELPGDYAFSLKVFPKRT
ncbi:MAG TPA: alpha-L-fucosidase [Terracidiphilus sp.]